MNISPQVDTATGFASIGTLLWQNLLIVLFGTHSRCTLEPGFGWATGRGRWGTHGIDARQLLGQLQHHGDEDGLVVGGGAEQLQDGDLLLPHHLPAFFFHLLQVSGHISCPSKLLQHWWDQREGGVAQSGGEKGLSSGGQGGGQGPARTTLGPVLLISIDEQEAGALGAEGQQDAL